jgi:hypothetical protein
LEAGKAIVCNLVGRLGLNAVGDKREGEAGVLDPVLEVRNCLELDKAVDQGLGRSGAAVAVVVLVVEAF